jgi:hypothetical protein
MGACLSAIVPTTNCSRQQASGDRVSFTTPCSESDLRPMDYPIVPDILWEEPAPSRLYVSRLGDILITLDVNNVAETSLWTENKLPSYTTIRGA